jgi:Ca2+-transporting ATPase
MDLSKDPCKYFTDGKVKASTLSLSVLVMIEMLNAFNALSEDNSIFVVTPLVNPFLIAAATLSTLMHMMIVYIPFFNDIFSIHSMTSYEWMLVLAFSLPVNIVDEMLKFYGRIKNERELKERLK